MAKEKKVEEVQETGIHLTVVYGANEQDVKGFTGKTVGDIRAEFKESLNIPDGATAYLNGDPVDDSETVSDDDSLEFTKLSGKKG
jgi:hypothetical protein